MRTTPAIGFNQYSGSSYKYMATGFSASQKLNMITGNMYFDIYPSGTTNNSLLTGKRALSLYNNGNVGIQGATYDASLSVNRGSGFYGTTVFLGTKNHSHFNYSGAEDTYIRGGLDGSSVYINDILNGNILLGNGTSKVGINTTVYDPPAVALDVNGAVTYRTGFAYISDVITVVTIGNRSYVNVTNTQNSSGYDDFTITDGITPGQILIIESAGTNTPWLNFSAGVNVSMPYNTTRLYPNDTITLIWNGTKWHQTSISHNRS